MKKSRQPRTLIVRIYRQTAHSLVGQVEEVRSGVVRPFRTASELWRALGKKPAPLRSRRNER